MAGYSAFETLKANAKIAAEQPTSDALQLLAIQGERKWEAKFKHRFKARRDHMAVRTDLETRSVDGATTVRVRDHGATTFVQPQESVISVLGRCIDGFSVKAKPAATCKNCGLSVSCICHKQIRRDKPMVETARRDHEFATLQPRFYRVQGDSRQWHATAVPVF